ncbi:MAG: HD domain-containing protein [Clostridia bacterium]|nr:HD domain-containing protein [Clostridia bacterium]
MLNRELTEKTEEFVKAKFENAEYFADHPEAKAYRLEHTYRVANIGREIAQKEGFDETEAVIACLLHDVSYCETFDENGWPEHGRRAAAIARGFLEELGLAPERINDICFGIAIHVDGKADFEGEETPFALSVGDADNLDRFDVYRIHETLMHEGFLQKSFEDKREYAAKRLERLREIKEMPLATDTAHAMWNERLDFYITFYEKLLSQLENSLRVL